MLSWLHRIYQDLATGQLGRDENGQRTATTGWLLEGMHAVVILVREVRRDRLTVRAAMLAYWTAVAIVPILLIGFTLSAPLGGTEAASGAVRRLLYDTILTDSVETVGTALDSMLAAANLRALGIVGVVGLMVIGSQLYFNAELAYNDIFRSSVRRSLLLRFTLFYAAITLAPAIMAFGFLASATLPDQVNVMRRAVPVMLTATVLVGAIRLLPNRRVSWTAALVGGLFSAVVFEVAKSGFTAYTTLMGTQDSMAGVYGSLAFLPVFLLWLQIVWMVVLIGVELAFITENYHQLVDAQRRDIGDPNSRHRRADGFFGLGLLGVIARAWKDHQPTFDTDRLSAETGADPRHVQAALDALEAGGLLTQTEDKHYVMARAPDQLTAAEVLECWRRISAPAVQPGSASADVIRDAERAVEMALSDPGSWIPLAPAEIRRLIPPEPDRRPDRPTRG